MWVFEGFFIKKKRKEVKKMTIKMGLCAGRHEIPDVEEYIFETIEDPCDFDGMTDIAGRTIIDRYKLGGGQGELHLYVTGLTQALISVINVCLVYGVNLTLYHFDRQTGGYLPQKVATRVDCDLVGEAGYGGYSSRLAV
ncbi:MAG: hypothetical protein LUB63_01335 [Oscillospiraceae bacterium]|nr:hypothetical protein [Oscillospiraceae bacterium]